ncbi:MAG: transposase [Chloroflexi bacterium]|nr:transposase [Chloroflexota bacterium]
MKLELAHGTGGVDALMQAAEANLSNLDLRRSIWSRTCSTSWTFICAAEWRRRSRCVFICDIVLLGGNVGIKTLAICSDGTCYANPKALAAKIKLLRRWQRRLSRRVKGGKNRSKARRKVARLHMQVANVRRDAHNEAAHAIIDKRPSVLVIEELNVKGMFKNRGLARALSDAALGQFGRILTYMAGEAGVIVLKAGRFFASSKSCLWMEERTLDIVRSSVRM